MRNLISFVAGAVGILAAIAVGAVLFSWDAPAVNEVGLSYSGGPLEGIHYQGIKRPGSSGSFQGIQDKLVKLPANQRTYTVSQDSNDSTESSITATNKEGVNVTYETITYFQLNQDPNVLQEFYEKVCTKYNDCLDREDAANDGWGLMLRDSLGRTEQTAIQSQTRKFTTDALVQDDLAPIQEDVGKAMKTKVNENLGGPYFTDIRFSINHVSVPDEINARYNDIKSAELKTQTAKQEVQQAEQKALAAEKLQSTLNANPHYIEYLNAQAYLKAVESGSVKVIVTQQGQPVNINTSGN